MGMDVEVPREALWWVALFRADAQWWYFVCHTGLQIFVSFYHSGD